MPRGFGDRAGLRCLPLGSLLHVCPLRVLVAFVLRSPLTHILRTSVFNTGKYSRGVTGVGKLVACGLGTPVVQLGCVPSSRPIPHLAPALRTQCTSLLRARLAARPPSFHYFYAPPTSPSLPKTPPCVNLLT